MLGNNFILGGNWHLNAEDRSGVDYQRVQANEPQVSDGERPFPLYAAKHVVQVHFYVRESTGHGLHVKLVKLVLRTQSKISALTAAVVYCTRPQAWLYRINPLTPGPCCFGAAPFFSPRRRNVA